MKRPVLHLICNAHLDPVWQWRWEEGCAEALATFDSAVRLLKEHPTLIFNHNEAVLYRWVKEYNPALFREIRRMASRGRWCTSGGWYLQPDVNMPPAESLIRQIVQGRRFFQQEFKQNPRVAYNLDSFGHSAGLPQILVRAGYRMYVHMRPQAPELTLPSDLYRWRGVDGSEILTYRISVGLYHTERDNIEQRLQEGRELALKLGRDVPVFWGIGNHGGGATREDLEKIDAFMRRTPDVAVRHSTPERLYRSLEAAGASAPLFAGELGRVFTGCYTSLARVKRRAQANLGELVQTEALRTASWWLAGEYYPVEHLERAWRNHLFNDFHDILPGSCTEPAERDALDLYGHSSVMLRKLKLGAACAFNRGKPLKVSIPLTVANASGARGWLPVEAECMLDLRPRWKEDWHLRLFTRDGAEIPCQEEQPESLLSFQWRKKVSFMADLPLCGVRKFHLEATPGRLEHKEAAAALATRSEEEEGLITSLDAGGGRECLTGPLFEARAVADDGDSWGTQRWSYPTVLGRFEYIPGSGCTTEQGPVRRITQAQYSFRRSRLRVDTIHYAHWPVVEFRFHVEWNEARTRLKLAVPTVFGESPVTCEIPGGAAARPADGKEQVFGRWFLLEGAIAGRPSAVAVVTSGQHGLDYSRGEVGLSVLRSAAYCHEEGFSITEYPARKFMDQGVHEFRLLVTAGDPPLVRRNLPGFVGWMDAPPQAYSHLPQGSGHKEWLFDTPGTRLGTVTLLACKRSWDARALILRLQETMGTPETILLELAEPRRRIQLSFTPFEIKTIRIRRSGAWRPVHMLTER